ncbi:MAG: helix-turn-helix domain-containing protein [Clostridia bacterium]|nr:helix-turn-helix domain-containing protein [Clostridia bacterium]
MERNFPIILSELRKDKGLSQKEAATQLGISQALLSHYEKGIRECGQSFLIKVADFYGVSCDYLLGRTSKKNEAALTASMFLNTDSQDTKPTSQTLIKACALLTEALHSPEKLEGVQLEMLMAIGLYKIILVQAYAGHLPKNWTGKAFVDGKVHCTPAYLAQAEYAAYNALRPKMSKNPEPEAPIPDALNTVVKMAEDYVLKFISEANPPMPLEYFK